MSMALAVPVQLEIVLPGLVFFSISGSIVMSVKDYRGIKVDKCSECEGIWLDAGELEAVSKLEKTGLDKLFSVFKK